MADVRRTPQDVSRSGLAATYYSGLLTADTQVINNDGRVVLHFKKSGAGACTVTIATPNTIDGQAVADRTVNVPATTGDVFVGPFPEKHYNDPSGDLRVTLSEITGLTLAVLRV
jgi:hypothetical protein